MRQPTQQELQVLINGRWEPTEAHAPLMIQTFPTSKPENDIFDATALAYYYGESICVFDSNEVTDKDQLAAYFQQHEGITIADLFGRLHE